LHEGNYEILNALASKLSKMLNGKEL